jgi:hypothetical protein
MPRRLSFCSIRAQKCRLFCVAKKIIATYREADLGLARLWIRSWKARGWKPGIRLARGYESLRLINFGQRPGHPVFKIKRFGAKGWKTAPLVRFPANATEDDVLNCGRAL